MAWDRGRPLSGHDTEFGWPRCCDDGTDTTVPQSFRYWNCFDFSNIKFLSQVLFHRPWFDLKVNKRDGAVETLQAMLGLHLKCPYPHLIKELVSVDALETATM